jgi:hypothetical protein
MKWKLIKKELPENNRMVFVCAATDFPDDKPDYFGAVVYSDGSFGVSQMEFTHWMYPPKISAKERKGLASL